MPMQSTLGNYLALSLLLLICREAAADGIFYGSKCITDTNIEEREGNAEVVLSGKIKAIHRTNHNTNSTTYHCSIHIYRVMKGDTIVSSLLGLPAESRNHYTRTIEVAGFGNAHICDSDVTHGDVRIFLLSYTRESNLTLNSSLVRIGIRSLKLKLTSNPDEPMNDAKPMLSECKFFYCSFYAECKLGFFTQEPYCECPGCENEIPEQVCGSDGKWYRNKCETRKASCLRRRRIKPVHPFKCRATARPTPSTKTPLTTPMKATLPPKVEATTTTSTTEITTPTEPATIPTTTTPITTPTKTTTTLTTTVKQTTAQKDTTTVVRSTTEEDIGNLIDTTTEDPVDGVTDPCKNNDCQYGAKCIPSVEGSTHYCHCPQTDSECREWYGFGDSDLDAPVCGSDGRDYQNMCMMRKYTCSTFTEVSVAKLGKCNPCDGFRCPTGKNCIVGEFNKAMCECSTICPDNLSPVCGTDGRTYDNECLLQYAQCLQNNSTLTIAYVGRCKFDRNPCLDIECSYFSTCKVSDSGTPTCQCPSDCPPDRDEICGEDGVTYRNLCKLQQQSCVQRRNITIAGRQPCEENTCLNYDCPNDGECELRRPNKEVNVTIPTCVCPKCPATLKPVCGQDGKTYLNECDLRKSNCLAEKSVNISHQGSCNKCSNKNCEFGVCHNTDGNPVCLCPVDACIETNSPVCADDGLTYPSICQLTVEECKQQRRIAVLSDGPCDGDQCERETPCVFNGVCVGQFCLCDFDCPESGDYICGGDQQTYVNQCALQKESCRLQRSIPVAYRGQCTSDRLSGSGDDDDETGDDGGDGMSGQTGNVFQTTTQFMDHYCNQDTNCRFDGQCDYTGGPPGVCRCTGFFDFCKNSADSMPSCGSDGVLYNNICELRETQCKTQRQISLRAEDFCAVTEETTPQPSPTPLCYDSQSPSLDSSGSYINCSTCLPNQIGQCDLCPANSYCAAQGGHCCPKDVNVPECTYTEFGCCPDNVTIASPGPEHRGCPYTCKCHQFGANSILCDPLSFQCDCKLGVVGRTCDACKSGWWGIRLINTQKNEGCLPCQCNALGSTRPDCEQNVGRCLCREGVTGLKCDRCHEEGQILTSEGCVVPDDMTTDPQEAETCDTKDCGKNGQCVVNDEDKAECTCDYECGDKVEYICGSDGQTYVNICQLRRKACKDGDLEEVMRGPCQQKTDPVTTTTTTPEPTTKAKSAWDSWWGGILLADEPSKEVVSTPDDVVAAVKCDSDPCHNGATCKVDSRLGFVCLCPAFWTGRKCDEGNMFTVPSFSGNSYMRLVGWEHPFLAFHLRLTVITTNATGIILYAGRSTGKGDFVSLVINDGHLEFRFDTGGGAALLRSEDKLIINRKYTLWIKRTGLSGELGIMGYNNTVYMEAPGTHTGLNVDPELLVGHVREDVTQKIPKRVKRNLGQVTQGLSGCISMIHDSQTGTNFDLTSNLQESLILAGRDIGECQSNPCLIQDPCQNDGICRMVNTFNYICECRNGFSGANCQLRPKSTRDLMTRGRRLRDKYNGISRYVVELPRFSGSSYIEYRLRHEVEYNMTATIIFSTKQPDGVLLYGSHSTDGTGDFILLSFENYSPVLRFDLGSGLTTLRMDGVITPKKWNFVEFSKVGRKATLSLNGDDPVTISAKGEMKYLNIQDHVTLGAIPPGVHHSEEYLHTPGLVGVIQWVSINGEDISDLFHAASMLYDIKRYHGAPCHPNPCRENHICQPVLEGYRCDPIQVHLT